MSSSDHPLSLAILGTRGVPPRYGGFETFAAELGSRLVARGHDVTVYCRSHLYPDRAPTWEGIRLVHLPAIRHKYLETVSHALLSAVHALGRRYDAILLCNAANAAVLPLLRATGAPVATNVDGIERMRRKWNVLGRLVYRGGEALASSLSSRLVADAETIAAYYRRELGADPAVIAYGADFPDEPDSDVLRRLGVAPDGYALYVSRFEPENHPLEVALAWGRLETDLPLVMVGSAPYAGDLIRRVREAADSRVLLPGALYGRDYRTLQRHARLYIQATEVGGTHPALIEAMGSNGRVLALDTPENREVGGEAVRYFRFDGEPRLERVAAEALADPSGLPREAARRRAGERYRWEAVTDAYERLLREIARQ
ncbi:MAG TPA: glycosyltransferase [Thermoanaerobaculia bacterium]|nr:glycosyltransferase [Thermoanaerobaculia bacterium]